MKAIVLLSGGLDSTVLASYLLAEGNQVECLSFDYGQKHRAELSAASGIAAALGVKHTIAELAALKPLLGGSSQTDDGIAVPEGHYADDSMRVTVVPNRNMIMLSVAAGFAISQGFDAVAISNHAGDHAVYPDCRSIFVEKMRTALRLCHYTPIELVAPFTEKSKAEIVTVGSRLGAPVHLSRSCYKAGIRHCGKCGTCVERREAFQLAGVSDPTEYDPS